MSVCYSIGISFECLPACERIHRVTRHAKANKASALAKLGEETAECDKALELFNATELQQVAPMTRFAPLFSRTPSCFGKRR